MPDSKISGLTSATTPLAGTEVLPIVQSGQTRQVSVANLTAGRAMSAGLITSTGGLVAPGVLTNFADPSGWTTGTGTATGYFGGNFTANGTVAAEDTRQYSSTPVVSPGLVWSATSSDTASDAEGGWNKTITGLVDSKTYRSVVWVRRVTASTSGTFYHGCSASTTLNLNGTTNTNPYFGPTSISGLVQDRWYLSVGYIHANADASVTSYGGLYDSTTGAKVVNYTDFKLSSGATSQVHRTFLYYSTDTTTQLDLWGPRFEEVTGNEPSVYSMLLSSSNNVATATALQNTRTLWGQNFNGTANVTGALTSVGNITGTAGVTLTATAGTLGLVATGANVITASTNGSERMRITSAGDVGIGTSSPATKLDVTGTFAARSTFSTYTGDGLFNANARFSYISTPSAATLRFGYQDDGGGQYNPAIGFRAPATLGTGQTNYSNAIWSTTNGALAFGTGTAGSYSERMRITSAGDVGIGTSSPTNTLTVAGNANITGNTTLGDASTDTVTVNGYMGVGGAATTNRAVSVVNTALSGTTQSGVVANITGTSGATTGVNGLAAEVGTAAAVFTAADVTGLLVQNAFKGAGSTITNQHGVRIVDQTQGTNNYGITSLVSSGSNKWNIYASGTAQNYFAGNVGIGTNSLTQELTVQSGAGTESDVRVQGNAGASGYLDVFHSSAGTGLWSSSTQPMQFGVNAVERLRLSTAEAVFNDPGNDYDFRVESDTNTHALFVEGSSGNVGIGTSSPSVALQVNGTSNGATLELLRLSNTGTGANTKARLNFYAASTNYASITGGYGASAPEMVFDINTSAGAYIWNNNATEQMRIDSSGNLGLGVTPSAWNILKGFDISSGGALFGYTAQVGLANNAYYDGSSWRYKNTDAAAFFRANALGFEWHTAPSGTAGNAISFTQAMTLDASGNLLVGRTALISSEKFSSVGYALIGSATNTVVIGESASELFVGSFTNHPIQLRTNNTERMRITAAGDVGIGTSSPSAKLDVVGGVEATAFLDGPLYDSAFKRFTNPGGGIYTTTTASVTGAIRITFPVGATNTMVKVTVKVYEYQTNRSFEIHFGGYTSTSGPSWANNPYAYIVGNPTINRQFTVRLGYDSTAAKMVAYIGELASTWPYPQVYVTEVQCGYGGFSANFATGWAIGFEATAFQNVTATISNPQVGYQAVAGDAIQGSVRYTSTTNTSGCFYGGTTTPTGTTRLNYSGYLYPTFLNLIGSADTTTAATHYFVEQSSDGFVRPKTIANVRTEIVTTAAVSAATAAGAIAFAAGSAAAPSIYPTGDTNTGIFFPAADTIAFSEGGAESMRITSAGNVGIGTSSPSGKLHVYGGAIRTNSRVTNSQNYPLGHYSPGECVFEIDPTWTEAELQAFFNSSAVTWAAVADAPGGYCIYIDGAVNVGGVYNSGFSYIPVDTSDVYYMECWIQNVGSNQGHYMGSIDYNQSFSSLGGNPGSYGYWVMSNTDPGTTWTKVSGYIQGFGTAVSQFVAGTKYWTPMALFNYTAGTGTRACRISGWKVIRAYQPGNRFFSGNVGIGTSSPGAKLDVAGAARVQGDFFVYGTGDRFNVFPQTAGSGVNVVSTNNANSAYAQLTLDGIPLIFKVAGTERLRITSAGDVGIGTSSPSYTLDVRTNTSNAVRIGSSANAFGSLLSWDNSSGESRLMSIGAYALVFGTNTTERLRITAAGNIHTPAGSTTMTDGFIYIPAAAGAPTGVATAITGTVPLYYNSSANILYAYNSSWQTLIGTGTLPLISSNANGVVYLNSSSQATTSTALQFNGTELGVGVTPTAGVQIDVGAAAGSQIRVQAVTAGVDMRLNATGGAGNVGIVGTYSNHDAVFYTNATERARITAAGVLQLSPVAGEGGELNLLNPTSGTVGGYVDVSTANNFRLWTGNLNATMQIGQLSSTGGNIQFFTEASEKMRLTAAGVLGIGTSSPGGVGVHVQNNTGGALYYASGTVAAGGVTYLAYNASNAAGSTSTFTLWNDNGFSTSSVTIGFFSSGSTIPNELRINQGANAPMTFYTNGSECMRLTADGNLVREQPAPQALTASTTLTIAHLRTQIITVAGTGGNTITLTMPSVSTLNTYTTEMAVDTSFDVTFIATTTSNVNLSAVTNVTIVGSATITNNTSATYRFRKSSSTAFVVYRMT